ncbi:hypothetical protein DIE11_17145 [Burkholderia sp. Bp9012]|nr:hypothetical protein DIE11_17145 [Burkholderia sp. Bp9012]
MWACPTNAADMRMFREIAASSDFSTPQLPPIIDPGLKQILVPQQDWATDGYVSVSPVASAGLAHEVFARLPERKLPSHRWMIQSIPAAVANHGETLLVQDGAVRLIRRGVSKILMHSELQGNAPAVVLRGRVERMNVAGGMLSVGLPAITAIGGLVHSIERRVGSALEFAIGLNDSRWVAGARHTVTRGATVVPVALQGRIRAGQAYGTVVPKYGYQRDEIQANGHFLLLVRGGPSDAIGEELKRITRFAGGSVFDSVVDIIQPGARIEPASFIVDASQELRRRPAGTDALDAALSAYGRDGSWIDRNWFQHRNGYSLSMSGYAWLEPPQNRKNSRDNYPHVWAEPVFSLVTQGRLSEMAWWRLRFGAAGVRWAA